MKLSDFRYPLPRNLIAKFPANPRDNARLMVVGRADDTITGIKFSEIGKYFKKGDCLVVNETKVFPARLFGRKEKTNAKIEVISTETDEGKMLLSSFGGVVAILRYATRE